DIALRALIAGEPAEAVGEVRDGEGAVGAAGELEEPARNLVRQLLQQLLRMQLPYRLRDLAHRALVEERLAPLVVDEACRLRDPYAFARLVAVYFGDEIAHEAVALQ